MLPVALDGLNQWIASRRFNNKAIALKNLRFGGHVAGAIDECKNGRIRGWIYDTHRGNDIIRLDVCVEDTPVAQISADVYRDDIARLLEDNGIHGFDATIPGLRYPIEPRSVTVRLVDNPKYVLRAVETDEHPITDAPDMPTTASASSNGASEPVPSEPSSGPAQIPAEEPLVLETASLSGAAMTQDLDFRLQHIFDHITAAHEDTLRRLDKIEAEIKFIKDTQNVLMRSRSSSDETSLLIYDAPRGSIAGIGSWRPQSTSDRTEVAIVRTRIEQALLKARLGARPGRRDPSPPAIREAS